MLQRILVFCFVLTLLILSSSCRNKQAKISVKPKPDSVTIAPTEKIALDALQKDLAELNSNSCFRGADLGYLIIDFTKGKPIMLFESNSRKGMIPASTQKILTTAAALEIFGSPVYHEVTITNLNSVNWRANRMLQKIGEYKYKKRDFFYGSKAVMEFWQSKGIDMKGSYICDGSGKFNTPKPLYQSFVEEPFESL